LERSGDAWKAEVSAEESVIGSVKFYDGIEVVRKEVQAAA
jgi:hypothetical protein